MAIPNGLLDSIRNRLNITWDDPGTNEKLVGIIEDGIFYLNDKLGEEADYVVAGYPRTLLFEYCRLVRDEALDVFENNYLPQILSMQNKKAVKDFAESTEQTEA